VQYFYEKGGQAAEDQVLDALQNVQKKVCAAKNLEKFGKI